MSGSALPRRALLRAGAGALAGAVALPAAARAATGDEAPSPSDSAAVLTLLTAERGAVLVYRGAEAAGLGRLRTLARDHAAALTTQLAAFGIGPPGPKTTAAALSATARAVAGARTRSRLIPAAHAFEEELAHRALVAVEAIREPNTLMTVGTILAAHGQLTTWLGWLAEG